MAPSLFSSPPLSRQQQADMGMVHKIMHGNGQLDHSCWFEKAAYGQRTNRDSAGPLNLRVNHDKLEIRQNFFSVRMIESGNKVPSDFKTGYKNVVFRLKYKKLRALPMQPDEARVKWTCERGEMRARPDIPSETPPSSTY
jgi:hypothetical protein